MTDTAKLLHAYTTQQSEAAFTSLVTRYIDLVYSVACRQVNGDAHLAQDISQNVFRDLATKASTLSPDIQLGGWLHRHTCFVASNTRRSEARRQKRENEAVTMNPRNSTQDDAWRELAPDLDQAINRLNEPDRLAIVMRFFEERNLRDIGAALKTSEDSAQKRVTRALQKLRAILAQQGLALALPTLTTLLHQHCVASAPSPLSRQVTQSVQKKVFSTRSSRPPQPPRARTTSLKVAAGIAAALTLFILVWPPQESTPLTQTSSDTNIESSTVSEGAKTPGPDASIIATATPAQKSTSALKLILQSKVTGQRLPGVRIKHRSQLRDDWDVRMLRANRSGEITIPFQRTNLRMLQLFTQIDGYADTRLEWHPDRGDTIPAELTVSLGPATRIGGRVVNDRGQPILGAKVGFNHEDIPSIRTRPLSHEFAWVQVETNAEGRWEINRLANDILPLIYGRAVHPGFVSSPFQFTSHDRHVLAELKSGEHLFTLGSTLTVSGTIVDIDGHPIPDADVRFGQLGSGTQPNTISDLEGRFVLPGCPPGEGLLTASAEGLAPVTLKINVSKEQEERQIVLKRGQQAILRVQDINGKPISGARVGYDTYEEIHVFTANSPALGPGPLPAVQVSFMQNTDSNGRVVWDHAPSQDLWFSVSAKGFMEADHLVPKPDNRVHVITLQPAFTVTGTITDDSTQEPIPLARMLTGWTDPNHNGGTGPPTWSTASRFQIDFSGGNFRHTFEEPVVVGLPNPGYILKFTAPGYSPFVTRRFEPTEGAVNLQIELTRTDQIPLTVLQPNGQPAAQANIAFIVPGARVNVVPGGLSYAISGQYGAQLFTDAMGHHLLNPDPARTHLVVAHEAGIKVTAMNRIHPEAVIELEPWGALEVRLDPSTDPGTPQTLALAYGKDNHQSIVLDLEKYVTTSTEDGKYQFDRVPPGTHRLERRIRSLNPGTPWNPEEIQQVEILPGQTTHISLP